MIITNAVTSERKDADYFFHTRQRKNLLQLVSNLRQASFFWSGFETEHIQSTVDNARTFLLKGEVPITPTDHDLLLQAVDVGEAVLSNKLSQTVRSWHEMPMSIQNQWPDNLRKAWSLDQKLENPTLMGTTMVHAAQNFVESQLSNEDPTEGMAGEGYRTMHHALSDLHSSERPVKKDN